MLVKTAIEERIGFVELNRPDKLNALSGELAKELIDVLDNMEKNDEVKVIILSGSGKSFSAGGDIDSMKHFSKANQTADWITAMSKLTKKMVGLEKYIVAAVHGYAAGAGFSLALAADFIVAKKDAKFALSFKNLALIPDLGLIKLLSERLPPQIVKEWILSGRIIDAKEAYEKMIINRMTDGSAVGEAIKFSQFIVDGPQVSNKYVKFLVNNINDMSLDLALMHENMIQTVLTDTGDFKEGLKAFSEKRKPKFVGN
mgnify:CR=1 FL=1